MAVILPYREVQYFSPVILWLLGIIEGVVAISLTTTALTTPNMAEGERWGLLAAAALVVLIWFGFRAIHLNTEVDAERLQVRLVPLPTRTIALDRIRRCYVRTYRPIRDYGGWGWRFSRQGQAYNARGNRGVQLELIDGRRILIGSQNPEELLRALHAARHSLADTSA